MDIQALLCTPKTPRSKEIPNTPDIPTRSSRASTQSWDSRIGPRPVYESSSSDSYFNRLETPQIPIIRNYQPTCTRNDRIRIKTALELGHSWSEIQAKLGYTRHQIQLARRSRLTPQYRAKCGRKPKISTPKRRQLEQWLLTSPSHRRIAFHHIPAIAPHLDLQYGEHTILTAFKLVGYGRRVAKRKGFSDDPGVMAERLEFASEAIKWSKERLYRQIFSDEVWAHRGAHTQSYVTVKEDGSDRYSSDSIQHKYSKLPAWMFHGTIVFGGKGPAVFWEKEWGSMDSYNYDTVILNNVESFLAVNPNHSFVWMQDNASCHHSIETQENLRIRRIPYIQWPRYSPDLNLIEHVWTWMKNWIQKHYYAVYYDASKVSLEDLRRIIREAWDAVLNDFIDSLYESWWRRCQAVIDAKGGPTKY